MIVGSYSGGQVARDGIANKARGFKVAMPREDAYALVQAAAMETWEAGTPFRETLRKQAASQGRELDEAALDEVCRPERYVERLGPVFDRLRALR